MKLSQYFDISLDGDEEWFDPDLAIDTPLFLDPFLLYVEAQDQDSDWGACHATILDHFAQCYEIVARSGYRDGLPAQRARGLLTFPEPAEFCLGYTSKGTKGSGSGRQQANFILDSIAIAISAGLERPEHIEEISILNKGIGADLISDAACNILKPISIQYTKQIALEHGIPTRRVRIQNARCDLESGRWMHEVHAVPFNRYNDRPILLWPKRFLNDLPTVNADAWIGSELNEELRRQFNIGVGKRVPKALIVQYARQHPERIRAWIESILQSGAYAAYDFHNDPLGIIQWQSAGQRFCDNNPLDLEVSDRQGLRRFVEELIGLFRAFVEEQGGWRLLWNDDESEKHERAIQLALLGMARPYCRLHGIEIDREVELGRGPVDFKLSAGGGLRLLVEAKKVHNGKFWNGLDKQLVSYMNSDSTTDGWLLAVQYYSRGVTPRRLRQLPQRVRSIAEEKGLSISFSVVDARPKASASKL